MIPRLLIWAVTLLSAIVAFRERARLAPWVERARRLPLPVWRTPSRVSAVRAGGAVKSRAVQFEVRERIALPSASPVVALAESRLVEGATLLYAGTFDDGVFRVLGEERTALAVDARVNGLALDEQGTLVVATNGGAFTVDHGESTRIASGAFSDVTLWRGHAWLSSRRGLSTVTDQGLWTRGPAQGITADQPGALADCGAVLCIGASDGLWTFDGERASHHSSASGELPADWVTAAVRDGAGVWAGTFDGGLARLGRADVARHYAPADGLPDGHVAPHALASVSGAIYAGTPSGLVVIWGDTVSLLSSGELGEGVTAVIPAARGGLWVGGRGTVTRIEVSP